MNSLKSPFVRQVIEFAATSRTFIKIELTDLFSALERHAAHDWGDVSDATKRENEEALNKGGRLHSAYTDRNGVQFCITSTTSNRTPIVSVPADMP